MKRLHDESFHCLVACGVGPRVARHIFVSRQLLSAHQQLHLIEDFLCEINDDTTFESLMEKLGVNSDTNAYRVLLDQYETSIATPSGFLSPVCWFLKELHLNSPLRDPV